MEPADLVFSGIARQAEMIRAGELSSHDLVSACLARIRALDPQLNAWRLVLADEALADAGDADVRAGEGESLPLLGVPIAVKDDTDVAGTPTAWGTLATGDEVEEHDSACIARLREAGAIVLGKTNVPELTLHPFTESQAFGATRNPWDPGRTPGGSSGGTAAAVAAGMVGAGVGSDGGGSIRIPSAWCGLVGIKPTRNLVSMEADGDSWRGLAVTGPIARSVRDAALLLDALVERPPERPFVEAARADGGARLRIAASDRRPPGTWPFPRMDREWSDAMRTTAELLRSLGHDVSDARPAYGSGVASQFLSRYLRSMADDVAELPHPERLEARTLALARLGRMLPAALVDRLRRRETALRDRIWASLGEADVLLTPTLAQPAPPIGHFDGRGAISTLNALSAHIPFNPLANITGEPSISVPAGFSAAGMPLGVQLTARAGQEHLLIGLAAEIEAARPWADRRPVVS